MNEILVSAQKRFLALVLALVVSVLVLFAAYDAGMKHVIEDSWIFFEEENDAIVIVVDGQVYVQWG